MESQEPIESLVKKEAEPQRDPIASRSTSAIIFICVLLLMLSTLWALYDEGFGQRPWKPIQQEFVKRYAIRFPALPDRDGRIAGFLKATKTPEVFVLDSRSRVIYRGAVDNWAPALGQHREVITEHYLLDALTSFIENKTIRIKETEAVGCFIERNN